MAVIDAYDAMTHQRPYRPAMSREEALQILDEKSKTQFDGRVVKVLKDAVNSRDN